MRTPRLPYPLLFALLLAGCGDPEPPMGGVAVAAYSAGPVTANPLVATDEHSHTMNRDLLFLTPLGFGPAFELRPRLAESWEAEGDSAVLLRIRRDVHWSDGRPTTAADVVFTIERALDPETAYPGAQHIAHWGQPEALDSFTVRLPYEPTRQPLHGLALLPVLPRHVLDTVPPAAMKQSPFNMSPVTNGPFRLLEARPGDRWVFAADTAFPEELGGRPRLDRLVWRVIPETSAQEVELRAGDVDMVVGVRPSSFDSLVARDGLRGYEAQTLTYVGIAWNGRRPFLADPRVRRALTHAIDRREVLEGLRAGYGTLAAGPVPPAHFAHEGGPQPLPYDTARARSLLREAGYVDRDGDRVVEDSAGRPLRISLLLPAASDFNRDLAQVVQSHLRDVGVDLRLEALEAATMYDRISRPERDFDAVVLGMTAEPRLDLRSLFHSAAAAEPVHVAGFSDPALDSILDALDTAPDPERERELWAGAQARISEGQPWTFLYFIDELIVARERLRGVEADIRGVMHSAPEWWVENQ